MSNLEQSIAEWRRRMLAAGLKNPSVVDELESHLREHVERQMQSGLGGEEAFQAAVQQIGQPSSLKREFGKVGGRKWGLLVKLKAKVVEALAPSPSLNTFTASARQTLALARAEAPRFHHNFVGTEHVLLGLLTLENDVVANALKRMGVDREDVRKQLEKWIGIFPSQTVMTHLPYTPRVKKALRIAAHEAKTCQHAGISAEHIFLGLIIEGDGVAGRVLKNLGVKIQTARQEILSELGRNEGAV
jgi:hypothetical protein